MEEEEDNASFDWEQAIRQAEDFDLDQASHAPMLAPPSPLSDEQPQLSIEELMQDAPPQTTLPDLINRGQSSGLIRERRHDINQARRANTAARSAAKAKARATHSFGTFEPSQDNKRDKDPSWTEKFDRSHDLFVAGGCLYFCAACSCCASSGQKSGLQRPCQPNSPWHSGRLKKMMAGLLPNSFLAWPDGFSDATAIRPVRRLVSDPEERKQQRKRSLDNTPVQETEAHFEQRLEDRRAHSFRIDDAEALLAQEPEGDFSDGEAVRTPAGTCEQVRGSLGPLVWTAQAVYTHEQLERAVPR